MIKDEKKQESKEPKKKRFEPAMMRMVACRLCADIIVSTGHIRRDSHGHAQYYVNLIDINTAHLPHLIIIIKHRDLPTTVQANKRRIFSQWTHWELNPAPLAFTLYNTDAKRA